MSLYVEDYISRCIKKMDESSELENSKLRGKKLDYTDYFRCPSENRAINRYLSDTGFVPPKVQILTEIKQLEIQYEKDKQIETQQKINGLKLKYNMMK